MAETLTQALRQSDDEGGRLGGATGWEIMITCRKCVCSMAKASDFWLACPSGNGMDTSSMFMSGWVCLSSCRCAVVCCCLLLFAVVCCLPEKVVFLEVSRDRMESIQPQKLIQYVPR